MKLKPCPNPWCKDSRPMIFNNKKTSDRPFEPMCGGCGIEAPYTNTEAEAIEAWNARPFESHAVEVLFKYISRHHEMTEEKEKAMRTEARQLLGWEE